MKKEMQTKKDAMTVRKYLALTLDGMAKGLFASLIVGTIISQIGNLADILVIEQIGRVAQFMMGPAIGAGVALRRDAKIFTLLSAIAAGALGAGVVNFGDATAVSFATLGAGVGNPVGALLAAVAAVEVTRYVEGKTKFDLLIVPAIIIVIGGVIGFAVTPFIDTGLRHFGNAINTFTNFQPLLMGVMLAVTIGITLTLPIISSAALCIVMGIGASPDENVIGTIAAGAALAGCCAQMVGFAVISFRENKLSGLISQGIGTSMIQMPNIIKNPWVWLPPTVASAVAGLVSAVVFELRTTTVGAGMGTSGLVGPFQTMFAMGASALIPMLVTYIVIPAVVSLAISELMRKKGIIKWGDLKL
jgi:hypothetical protein